MNLALVGMQQDGTATATGIIHRMLARCEHGRATAGAVTITLRGIRAVMMCSLITGGSTTEQPPTPGAEPQSMMKHHAPQSNK